MRTFSTSISTLALGAVLATSLVMGGCGDKNKGKTASGDVKLEKIAPRKVDEAQATEALTALSLNSSGSGIFSWADKQGSGGNYTFTDVTITGDDDAMKVGTLELTGAHMEGDLVAFDKITLNNMSAEDEDANVAINKIELIKPSPTLSNELARAFSGDDDAFEDIEGDISVGGFSLAGLDIKGDDANVILDSMVFGEAKDKTGAFALKNLKVNSLDGDNVNISLGSIDAEGMNIEKYKGLFSEIANAEKNGDEPGAEAMQKIMSSLNPYAPDYKSFSFRDFDMDVEGLKIDFDSIEAKSSVKNGLTTITQKSSPITITPPTGSSDKEMKQIAEAFAGLGYDKLVFHTQQTSVLNEATDSMTVVDSYVQLDDGFKLSYDYDIEGVKAMMDKAGAMGANAADNPLAALDMMSAMKFAKMRLALEDNSIVDRAFKLAASQQGGTPEALKMQAKAGLGFLPMMAKDPGQQKAASELSAALGKLLDDGGTFIIEMNPETPVDLGALSQAQSGNLDVSTLGLSIRTE